MPEPVLSHYCERAEHGDNRRRHLVGLTFREILAAGEHLYTFDGGCGGVVRPVLRPGESFQDLRMLACQCACHAPEEAPASAE